MFSLQVKLNIAHFATFSKFASGPQNVAATPVYAEVQFRKRKARNVRLRALNIRLSKPVEAYLNALRLSRACS